MANTRSIPHIGSSRFRRFFGGRRFRRRGVSLPWVIGYFENQNVPVATTEVSRYVLASAADYDDTVTPLQGGPHIHRVQFQGGIQFISEHDQFGWLHWIWAVWQEDADETDAFLWQNTSNLFLQKRMLVWRYGSVMCTATGPSSGDGEFSNRGKVPISFDIKMNRKPMLLRGDERLVLGFNWLGSVNGILASAELTGLVRLAVRRPGAGR